MKQHFGFALLATAGTLLSGAASAQTAPSDPPPSNVANQQLSEVVVTGSRVITNGANSPTPLTVVNPEIMMALQPTTITDAVNLMPQLQGSQSTTTAAGGGQRNGAGEYFDLRDLGDLRTLVLYDGYRVIPTINQNEGDVDSSIVPQMLLKRVDIVTGGVSAVYGSDAISGVVNFVTDNHFNGVKVQGSGGVSTYGDDPIADTGIAVGRNLFGDRGHVEFSYEFHDDPGICCRDNARPFFEADTGEGGSGTAADPYYNIVNQRSSTSSFDGLITGGPLSGLQFAQNGLLSPFVNGTSTGIKGVQSGGDGTWANTQSIKAGQTFNQVFGRFDYDLTDTVHGFAQIGGTAERTSDMYTNPAMTVNIGYNNPFLDSIQQPYQSELAAQEALTPNGSFSFAKTMLNEPAGPEEQATKAFMFMGGLDGVIGKYHWTVGIEQAMSQVLAENSDNINMGNFYAATNSVVNPTTGQTVCNASLTNSAYANCVPLNLFGPTSESAEALQYIRQATWNLNHTTLSSIDASLTGAPVSTWAGPVNMDVSAEGRRTGWSVSSNASPNTFADCAGIEFSCTQGITKLWLDGTMPANPGVAQNVGEVAYETDVPLAKDLPAVQALSFNGAVRETHYSNSGPSGESSSFNANTWKLGLVWRVNDSLTFRATRSRDIRAPNLWELYAPETIAPLASFTDPLTKTAAPTSEVVESNPKLVPEVANTVTAGLVYHPQQVPGLNLSVDYFQINVAKVIFQLQGQSNSVINGCDASGGTSSLCSLIVRPYPISNTSAANFPTVLLSQYLNLASLRTYGGDFEADYGTDLSGHKLDMRLLTSYQPHLILNQGPGGVVDLGDTFSGVNLFPSSPSVKATFIGEFGLTHDINVSVLERWRNSMRVSATPGLVYAPQYEPSLAYTTINLSYLLSSSVGVTELYLNVQNVFNTFPTIYFASLDHSLIGEGDDPVGRYFTIGFRFSH